MKRGLQPSVAVCTTVQASSYCIRAASVYSYAKLSSAAAALLCAALHPTESRSAPAAVRRGKGPPAPQSKDPSAPQSESPLATRSESAPAPQIADCAARRYVADPAVGLAASGQEALQ